MPLMPAPTAPVVPETHALAAFVPYLESDTDVLCCAALRALRTQIATAPDAVRSTCARMLQDPDPDLRSDAMDVLAYVATADDADAVRFSLAQDPVREVKLAAIRILAALKDEPSKDLLRALVLSRNESDVAWEDENSDWEDWLDIQIAAIRALGDLQATDAIEDLLSARDDEYGQSLDIPVFAALCDMGPEGIETLVRLLQAETGTQRLRAAKALRGVAPEALAAHLEVLMTAPEPALRLLALDTMTPEDPRGRALADQDGAPDVRAAALLRFAGAAPELVLGGLSDPSEAVRSAALNRLPGDADFAVAVVENMLAWLPVAGAELGTAIAAQLVRLAPQRALQPLASLIEDTDRPLELRIAAVTALGRADPGIPTAVFRDFLANPAQQVRAACLTVLRTRAQVGDLLARETLCAAITGTALSSEASVLQREAEEEGPDLATPKEGAGRRRVMISPDGEILETEETQEPEQGHSTLSAILAAGDVTVPEQAGDTPEEAPSKRRKRRPVEGPDRVALSLSQDALRIAARVVHPDVAEAIVTCLEGGDPDLRPFAWAALAEQGQNPDIRDLACAAHCDDDPLVRFAAFKILMQHPDEKVTGAALSDEDALIRACALDHVPATVALVHLGDPALAVRDAAAARILASNDPGTIRAAVDSFLTHERADGLAGLIAASDQASEHALSLLRECTGLPRRAFVLLEGLAGSFDRRREAADA